MSSSAPIVDRIRIIPRPDDFLDRNVGASGEVFFNRATSSLRIYNGRDRGGFEVARADLANVDTSNFLQTSNLSSISIEEFSDVMYMLGPPTDGQVLVWRTDHWMPEDVQFGGGGGASVDVSDTAPSAPESGNLWLDTKSGRLYIYITDVDSSQWVQPSTVASGGTAADANTLQGQNGAYYLNYNNFTNTPTSILDFGITDGTDGQILTTDGNGNFTFVTLNTGGGGGNIDLTALSVTQQTASGNGSLTYNNITGVFTFTPPNLSSFLTSYTETDTLASVTARGATTNAAVTINNTLTVSDLATGGAGTPTISSSSSFIISAVDGVTVSADMSITGLTTLQSTTEVVTAFTGSTGTVVHNLDSSSVFYHQTPSANFTANFTNVPTTNNRTVSIALILANGVVPYMPTAVQIDGVGQTIRWQGGSAPSGTSSGTDVVGFTLIRTGNSWTVIGSSTSYS